MQYAKEKHFPNLQVMAQRHLHCQQK
jgi:hypothetical protein